MGMICEFYRLNDDEIINLKKLTTNELIDYLAENYANVYGEKHEQGNTVFSLDKAWDVTRFLIQESDPENLNILKNIYGNSLTETYDGYSYLLSQEVNILNKVLQNIETKTIISFYNEDKMNEAEIYQYKSFELGFIIEHFLLIKLAFQKATNTKNGLIINIA